MSFCSFADGAAMFDATPIENLFLMEYMYDAPAPALKVYLYARMLALHPELGGTLEDIAKALRLREDEVYEGFTYWENRGLVRRLTDQPPTYAFQAMRSPAPSPSSALDREMYANRDFNNRLRQLFGDQFIGDHELRKAGDWRDILKYDQEAILRMVRYGIEQSPRKNPKPPSVFKRVNALAEEWSRRGARTLEDVEAIIAQESGALPAAREVLKKLGIARQPSEPELAAVRRWTEEWGLTLEELLAACDETLSARNPTIKYLDAILTGRRNQESESFDGAAAVLRELNPQMSRPSPDQIERYKALLAAGYSHELMVMAAVQCHRRGKYAFDDLEWRLGLWRKDGVDTPQAAEAYTAQMAALAKQLREVFRAAGFEDRRPGYGAIKTYQGWRDSYPPELIQYAAECSKHAGGSMAYMDKLLRLWAQDGVATLEQAQAQHAAHRLSDAEAAKPANPALDYAQREYKDEDFGDDFYFDYDRFYGSEGEKP